MITVKVKKLTDSIPDLGYAKHLDAGMDLCSTERVVLVPGIPATISTGIALEIPEGYVGLIWDKSGLSVRNGLKVLGGVIDAGYRGEVLVGMINLSQNDYIFEIGNKVAQILFQKIEHVTVEVVDELADSDRGETGFGSSGK